MTSVSRAAQRPARADDPGAVESEARRRRRRGHAACSTTTWPRSGRTPGAYDEMFSADGSVRVAVPGAARGDRAHRRRPTSRCARRRWTAPTSTRASRSRCPGQERPFPLDIVPRVISAAEWTKLQRGHRAARPGAGDVPGRHLRRRRDRPRRRAAATPDHQLRALPPGRGRARPAERRAHPRRRDRPGPRRAGRLPGAGGQPAQPVGRVVRDGEPPHDGARLPRPVHPPAGARGRRLRHAPAAGPARRGRAERGRPDRRRAHPRRLQLGLLRALAAGPADGRRAGRGPRPVLPRQPRLHAHHRRATSGST